MKQNGRGFTIVELLIVIVMIAILAAITIVAYTGITNRANDSIVQSDLASASKMFDVYYADNSRYPAATQVGISSMNPLIRFSKSSYETSNNAVLYCAALDGSAYSLIGKSKSGKTFLITSTKKNPSVFGSAFPTGAANDCPNSGISNTIANWVHTLGGGWQAWTN